MMARISSLPLTLVVLLLTACAHVEKGPSPSQLVPQKEQAPLTPAAPPYPPSEVITGLSWDFANQPARMAIGSDLWPTTWGSDGKVWTNWGDGGGFHGSNRDHRTSLGFAKIAGFPPDITGVNVWGNAAPPQNKATAKYQATFCGKSDSMLSVRGVLYAWVGSYYNRDKRNKPKCPPDPRPGFSQLSWSMDQGRTWRRSAWRAQWISGQLQPGKFLNFGKDYDGVPPALAGYIYMYGGVGGNDEDVYLLRVRIASVKHRPTYRVFQGLDACGKPMWTSSFAVVGAAPVFHDPNLVSGFTVSYHAASARYLATAYHGISAGGPVGQSQKLGVFEAPQPWGPWRTVQYTDGWGPPGRPYGAGEGLGLSFPNAWVSADGKTLWGVFSSAPGTDAPGDAFNMLKATLSYGPSQRSLAHCKRDD